MGSAEDTNSWETKAHWERMQKNKGHFIWPAKSHEKYFLELDHFRLWID